VLHVRHVRCLYVHYVMSWIGGLQDLVCWGCCASPGSSCLNRLGGLPSVDLCLQYVC
jgi:hypothetical protein